MHFDLEDLAFQDFEEDIVLGNDSDANKGRGNDDVSELIHILPMKTCLPVVPRSLLAHHDHLISKASKGNHVELFLEKIVGNNSKQESCALPVTGAITKLSASRKLITPCISRSLQVLPMSILLENTCLLIPLMGSNFLPPMVATS